MLSGHENGSDESVYEGGREGVMRVCMSTGVMRACMSKGGMRVCMSKGEGMTMRRREAAVT